MAELAGSTGLTSLTPFKKKNGMFSVFGAELSVTVAGHLVEVLDNTIPSLPDFAKKSRSDQRTTPLSTVSSCGPAHATKFLSDL